MTEVRGREEATWVDADFEGATFACGEGGGDPPHLPDVGESQKVTVTGRRVWQPRFVEDKPALEGDGLPCERRRARHHQDGIRAPRCGIQSRPRPETDLRRPDSVARHLPLHQERRKTAAEEVHFEIAEHLSHHETATEMCFVRVGLTDELEASRRAKRRDGVEIHRAKAHSGGRQGD